MNAQIYYLATRKVGANKDSTAIKRLGYRLVYNGAPLDYRFWKDEGLAIEAAKYAAAELSGTLSLAGNPPKVLIGVELVETMGEMTNCTGIAFIHYSAGSYLPQVKRLAARLANA